MDKIQSRGDNKKLVVGIIGMVFFCIGALFYFQKFYNHSPATVVSAHSLSIKDFKTQIDSSAGVMIIDIRQQDQHDAGFIPNSVNIPSDQIGYFLKNATVKTVYIYANASSDPQLQQVLTQFQTERPDIAVNYLAADFRDWRKTYPTLSSSDAVSNNDNNDKTVTKDKQQ